MQFALVLALLLVAAFAVILYAVYRDVRDKTLRDFDIQQTLLAKQAARGIQQFFKLYRSDLNTLAANPDIVASNARGIELMQVHYAMHRDAISTVTRMDENGIILYSVPYDGNVLGADISDQAHVKLVLSTQRAVLSNVFTAVQGFQTVAYHVPVFERGKFKGSVAYLIPFNVLSREFLEEIRPTDRGYAWVINQEGVVLYSPDQQQVGLAAQETFGAYPSVLALLKQMLARESGTGVYFSPLPLQARAPLVRQNVAYQPIPLENTMWSIIVASPETEILATMAGFHLKFLLIVTLYSLLVIIFASLSAGSILRIREQQYAQAAALEKQKLAEQHQAMQKLEAVGRLAAGVAHDLNNMLMPILGYSELLEDDPQLEAASREYLGEIQQATLRARDLTRQLLAFARKQPLQITPVDLNTIVNGMENLFRRTLHKNVALDITVSAGACTVLADRGQVEQVLMNLVMNALDAMPNGGRLVLATEYADLDAPAFESRGAAKPGQYGILTVSDTGGGMDPATRSRIFEPFFSTKGAQGTGLGLATVHGIVQQHGGSIWVDTAAGQGSTFRILLPAATAPAPTPATPPGPAPYPAAHYTVLLAEDDAQVLEITRQMLCQQGFSVLAAADAAAALTQLAACPQEIDILLTDVMMPEVDGYELFERARQIKPQLKVLFMSGFADEVLSANGVLNAGVQLIYKPFSSAELARRIFELLA